MLFHGPKDNVCYRLEAQGSPFTKENQGLTEERELQLNLGGVGKIYAKCGVAVLGGLLSASIHRAPDRLHGLPQHGLVDRLYQEKGKLTWLSQQEKRRHTVPQSSHHPLERCTGAGLC